MATRPKPNPKKKPEPKPKQLKPVSLWLGQLKTPPGTDLLKELCGVARYDLDSQECNVDDRTWKKKPVKRLLARLSYAESFAAAAADAAKARGIDEALYVLAQYEYAYNPKRIRRPIAKDPVFLGVFEYDEDDE